MASLDMEVAGESRSVPEGTPLPPGVYQGYIVKCTQKRTGADQSGLMLEVEFDIQWPEEYQQRKFWDRFNMLNASETAQRIGREQFGDLVYATGLGSVNDDDQLINQEVLMELYIEPAKPYTDRNGVQRDGKPQNRCRKYWPIGTDIEAAKAAQKAAKGGAAPAPAATAPKPAAAAPAKRSWGGAGQPAATPAAAAPKPATPPPAPAAAKPAPAPAAPAPAARQDDAPPPPPAAAGQVGPWKRKQ